MFTSRVSRAFTITAALVISATVIGANATRLSAQDEAAFGRTLAGTWAVTVDQPGFLSLSVTLRSIRTAVL